MNLVNVGDNIAFEETGEIIFRKIQIEYNGKDPYCNGNLVVILDGVRWKFPEHCLCLLSGGSEWDNSSSDGWTIHAWPDGFPEELHTDVTSAVNAKLIRDCCGDCL